MENENQHTQRTINSVFIRRFDDYYNKINQYLLVLSYLFSHYIHRHIALVK